MKNFEKYSLILLATLALAACDADVDMNDGVSEALAAAEAKLAAAETKLNDMTAYDQQIAAVRTWIGVWDSADVGKLDAVALSEFTRTAPDLNANSLDELKALILQVHATYPDFNITNDGIAAGPDGAFVQWTVTGSDTARGEAATGNSMNVTGISRYQFSDGKIASELVIFDTGSALTQFESAELPHTAQ
ncbi:MAG: ester cyclase [Gammaproteobacteria bacterium]|nr:ester cyclase [Gammaproteobacteria bacterium]MBU2678201.1 ester cyclase [Gammaproteobacteria bacterium]NNC56310.1 SnoaL-like domain-containing protein [Woeseiaceae bacterium]NNL51936.1 SnoaL-like domain-containing protein [Woeseiaceae bacterium]